MLTAVVSLLCGILIAASVLRLSREVEQFNEAVQRLNDLLDDDGDDPDEPDEFDDDEEETTNVIPFRKTV